MSIQESSQPQLLHDDKEAQRQPPEEEIQGHPMPYACHQPYSQQIENRPSRSRSASAQGDVEIIPKPSPQGDMPSAVILADTPGAVGMVEILRQLKAKYTAQAHSHETVSLKVKEKLYGIRCGAHPCKGRGDAFEAYGLYLPPENPQSVRDDYLESQAQHHLGHAVLNVPGGNSALSHLFNGMPVLGDRAGQELWKHGGKDSEFHPAFGRPLLFAVHIYIRGQQCKGIKADAGREGPGPVFIIAQKTCLEQNRYCQPSFSPGGGRLIEVHSAQQSIVDGDGHQQDCRPLEAAQSTENHAGPKQHRIPVFYGTQKIEQ